MAQTIITVDDVDGSTDASQVQFGFDGQSYVVDLAAHNKDALREALAPYLAVARKASTQSVPLSTRGRRAALAEVRAWARQNGFEVADQGRIPREIQQAYEAR